MLARRDIRCTALRMRASASAAAAVEGDLDDVQSAREQGLGQWDGVVGILNDGDTDEAGWRIKPYLRIVRVEEDTAGRREEMKIGGAVAGSFLVYSPAFKKTSRPCGGEGHGAGKENFALRTTSFQDDAGAFLIFAVLAICWKRRRARLPE